MADDIKIIIGTEDSDVLKTTKNIHKLDGEVKKLKAGYALLAKAQNSGRISAQAYANGVTQIDKRIVLLNKTLGSGHLAINKHATALVQSKNKMNKFGMVSQQVGYQVGDFFVQVQSGQSALVAFGQQGTQLAGLLPGVGGAIAGISIALGTLLAKAYFDSQKAAENASKAFEESQSALEDFEDSVLSAEEVVSSFSGVMAGILNQQTQDAWTSLAEITAGQFTATFIETVQAQFGLDSFKSMIRGETDFGSTVAGTVAAEKFAKAFGLENDKLLAVELDEILRSIKERDIFSLDQTIEYLSAFTKVNEEGRVFLQNLILARDAANGFTKDVKEAVGQLELAEGSAKDLADLDLSLSIEEAAKVAELLADRLGKSLAYAVGLVGVATGTMAGGPDAAIQQGRESRAVHSIVFQETYEAEKPKKKSGKSDQEILAGFIEKKEQEAALQSQLLGLFDKERSIQSDLIKFKQKYGDVASKTQTDEYEATVRQIAADKERQKSLKEIKKQQEDLTDFLGKSMETAMMGIVDGTLSVKDAFKSMAAEIIRELYRVLVVQEMVAAAKEALDNRGGIVSVIKSIFPFADGGAFSGGSQIQAYANGGVVNSPTTFPMSGGQTGLMGEAGPEAIMPLKRGANGKLGVQAEGGRSGDVININQSFNFQANGDDSVKKLIAQAAPKIADMAKASVIDSRRRGGSTKAAFG